MRCVRVVADQLEGVVGLDGAADVEGAAVEKGPAAVIGLAAADVGAEPRLGLGINLVEEVVEEDVLRRDGRVGLELEQPVAVVALKVAQAGGGVLDDLLDVGGGNGAVLHCPTAGGRWFHSAGPGRRAQPPWASGALRQGGRVAAQRSERRVDDVARGQSRVLVHAGGRTVGHETVR